MKEQGTFSKKVGIMGGSFNPIHTGHLFMAQRAMEDFCLDEVVFIPTGLQWMKKDDPDVLEGSIRLALTKEAVSDNPKFSVSDIEILRQGPTYTCETFAQLHESEPETEWFYIVGADTLANMEKWKNPELVFSGAVILCAVRSGTEKEALLDLIGRLSEKFTADIRFLDLPRMDISSTDIRRRIKEGKSIRYMVPEKVRERIEKEGYYAEREMG
ncbi:MAG: nicotinate-nucleotide adenylyltransferase [Lachnospiraceae bacterium]|nr:nicotinate-nucleotide adenylyltransferase [Lachnospiraceae bacterium]